MVNCSYYVFDWDRFTSDNPYTFKELIKEMQFVKFDIKEQVDNGCTYSEKDLEWWLSHDESVKAQLDPSPEDITVQQFVYILTDYLKNKKIKNWWSRANCFDPCLLQRSFEQYASNDELNKLLSFWKVRDVRTYIDTRFNFSLKKNGFCPIDDEEMWNKYFKAHDSRHDVAADILRLQKLERLIHLD